MLNDVKPPPMDNDPQPLPLAPPVQGDIHAGSAQHATRPPTTTRMPHAPNPHPARSTGVVHYEDASPPRPIAPHEDPHAVGPTHGMDPSVTRSETSSGSLYDTSISHFSHNAMWLIAILAIAIVAGGVYMGWSLWGVRGNLAPPVP